MLINSASKINLINKNLMQGKLLLEHPIEEEGIWANSQSDLEKFFWIFRN